VQSLVNATSCEQSLTATTEFKQSLVTPNKCKQILKTRKQNLANPSRPTSKQSLVYQTTPQRCEELQQQQPAINNSVQSHTESCFWDNSQDLPTIPSTDHIYTGEYRYEGEDRYRQQARLLQRRRRSNFSSDSTARVIKDAFSKILLAEKWKNVKRKFPHPDSVHTKYPKLDPPIESKLPKQAKDVDENLVQLQSKVLDVASPLVNLLESACRRDDWGMHLPADRRQKVTRYLNRELATLVKELGTFSDAAPLFLGKDFDKRAKKHIDTFALSRDLPFLVVDPISLFRGAAPREVATTAATSSSRNLRTKPESNVYNAFSEIINP